MTKTIAEILAPKPDARLKIYAYTIDSPSHIGLIKVGQTTRSVQKRIEEQTKTAGIIPTILLSEPAEREDGSPFTDHDVRARLVAKGVENHNLEWMRCTVADVMTAITELRTGRVLTGTHHATFQMREEQAVAVNKTHA
ncbi:GIY-YIG nuclease family protein, partial [Dietzia sp. UCD-THP]|uniref:GIY-YIG nuclease family protein n=1 Tax=Dietzia sp. UCD-THP TaxID=1292020 RepID=UPI00187C357F